MAIGVVTGMVSEAKLLEGFGYTLVSAGGHAAATRAKTERLIRDGVTGLISFGIAGALDLSLRPGDLVVADAVTLPDGTRVTCDAAWQRKVLEKVPGARVGAVAGSSSAATTAPAKGALYAATGALIVDMESHHVAELARANNLPFIVFRAIADTAQDDLPEAALVGLNEEGRPAIGAVLRSLLRKPWQLPALIRVALRSRAALAALLGGRAALL
ncbi:nucleoside phosphorylase [Dongia mobilis]|jgi:adenosylhomocysteine nucleosidase|uniref:phosphorylase family protein n=1 Tax=Dongia sp. TaxID=1977262 RepID=UPI0026F0B40E